MSREYAIEISKGQEIQPGWVLNKEETREFTMGGKGAETKALATHARTMVYARTRQEISITQGRLVHGCIILEINGQAVEEDEEEHVDQEEGKVLPHSCTSNVYW